MDADERRASLMRLEDLLDDAAKQAWGLGLERLSERVARLLEEVTLIR